jgi:hypothetical protein
MEEREGRRKEKVRDGREKVEWPIFRKKTNMPRK